MSDDKEVDVVEPSSPDIHFEPIIRLPEVELKSCEEDEDVLLKLRARLYRYCSGTDDSQGEWKERGTGEVKILKHKEKGTIRLLMRRDKTLKVCANHYIAPWMDLKPNCGSDKAFVWSVAADYADEEAKEEMLAIKFGNAEHASKFKEVFEESKKQVAEMPSLDDSSSEDDDVTTKLKELNVNSGEIPEPEKLEKTESKDGEKETDNENVPQKAAEEV